MKYLTTNGHKKITEELAYLTKVKRVEISEQLKFATSLGDLRENSEYDAVCEDYQITENRIYELEKKLNESQIYINRNDGTVEIGSIVTVKVDEKIETYEIVGYGETDLATNKISYETPLARALLEKTIGNKVTVENDYSNYEVIITKIV